MRRGLFVGMLVALLLASTAASAGAAQPRSDASCNPPPEAGSAAQARLLAVQQAGSRLERASNRLRDALAAEGRARTAAQRRRAVRDRRAATRRLRGEVDRTLAAATRPQAVAATIAPNTVSSFKLGRSLEPGPRSVSVNLAAPLPVGTLLGVRAEDFFRADDGLQVPAGGVRTWATVTQEKTARVTFCIDTATRRRMDPGTYQGTLVLADPRVQALSVPVTLTVSYPYWILLVALALLLCTLASVYTYTLRRPQLTQSYWQWSRSMVGLLTIASGLVAAALAFAAQYLDADAWGRDYTDLFIFVGAVSTAFVAGASVGRLVQNRYPPPG